MDANSIKNLGTVLRVVETPKAEQAKFLQDQRDRLAKKLREARIRVKANKAMHDGVYIA